MQDKFPYGKTAFWIFFAGFLALATVPSMVLLDSLRRYYNFLTDWQPGTLQSLRLKHLPHHGLPSADAGKPGVYFIEFRLHHADAKQVFLAGDFNRWKPESMPLARSRSSRGDWEILVPLPAGKYQYLFRADGAWIADPKSQASGRWNGLKTSIKQVPEPGASL